MLERYKAQSCIQAERQMQGCELTYRAHGPRIVRRIHRKPRLATVLTDVGQRMATGPRQETAAATNAPATSERIDTIVLYQSVSTNRLGAGLLSVRSCRQQSMSQDSDGVMVEDTKCQRLIEKISTSNIQKI